MYLIRAEDWEDGVILEVKYSNSHKGKRLALVKVKERVLYSLRPHWQRLIYYKVSFQTDDKIGKPARFYVPHQVRMGEAETSIREILRRYSAGAPRFEWNLPGR